MPKTATLFLSPVAASLHRVLSAACETARLPERNDTTSALYEYVTGLLHAPDTSEEELRDLAQRLIDRTEGWEPRDLCPEAQEQRAELVRILRESEAPHG